MIVTAAITAVARAPATIKVEKPDGEIVEIPMMRSGRGLTARIPVTGRIVGIEARA